jgi:hypothetical protein
VALKNLDQISQTRVSELIGRQLIQGCLPQEQFRFLQLFPADIQPTPKTRLHAHRSGADMGINPEISKSLPTPTRNKKLLTPTRNKKLLTGAHMNLENTLLDRRSADVANNFDVSPLPDSARKRKSTWRELQCFWILVTRAHTPTHNAPVDAIHSLLFNSKIPPQVEEENEVGGCEGDAGSSCLERD